MIATSPTAEGGSTPQAHPSAPPLSPNPSRPPRPPRPPRPTAADLAHIPSTGDWPLVSEARFLSNTLAFAQRVVAKCGPVSRGWWMFGQSVYLMSAQANELVLFDRTGRFSAKLGWERVLAELFPRGLMLRDAEDHRWHRRLMLPAFRKEALARYLLVMTPRVEAAIAQWGLQATQAGQGANAAGIAQAAGSAASASPASTPNFQFYPAIKRLTLAIAAEVFLGVVIDAEIDQISQDFTDLVGASVAVVRIPVIGRTYAKGVQGRARLAAFIRARIPQRRAGSGDDLFTQLCHARDEDDKQYSDEEIVDHLIFLMMAAHDTTTSAITTVVYALAKHPEWQDRLRREAQRVSQSLPPGTTAPALDDLATMTDIDLVFKEALRLYQPLPTIARRALVDFEIHGLKIPAGSPVAVFPIQVHRSPEWWTDPDQFDPERFAPHRAEHRRHPYAWAPFGGGAHMCLGLHFAEMQVKAILLPLLRDWQWQVPADYVPDFAYAPIAKPRDGLMIRLTSLPGSQ